MRTRTLILLMLILLLSSCSSEEQRPVRVESGMIQGEVRLPYDTESAGWKIGFDRRLELKEDARQIASLAKWLSDQSSLTFTVSIPHRDSSIVDEICAGRVDLAAVGTVSYLQAQDACDARILARGVNTDNEDRYRAAIIVRPESQLFEVEQLKGHSFAFGASNSTQGHLIPRLMLEEAGISVKNLRTHSFHDSHASVVNAIISGRFEAGSVQDTLAEDFSARGLVRILAYSDLYPSSGIIVGPHVPPDVADQILELLVKLDPIEKDAAALYHWERTEMPYGFVKANDLEYAELRGIAQSIGLLSSK